jgi:tryptophan synthase beta chain
MNKKKINYKIFPDKDGRFGKFGGRFVAETLMPLLLAVEEEYKKAKNSKGFKSKLKYYFENYIGRPSPLYLAERLSSKLNGAKLYFKRDELNHTGAHKINNCVGQILLAMQMGKQRIVAETGAGQHGLATCNSVCII